MLFSAEELKIIDELYDILEDIKRGSLMSDDRKLLYPIYKEHGFLHRELLDRIYKVFAQKYQTYFDSEQECLECFHKMSTVAKTANYFYYYSFATKLYVSIANHQSLAWIDHICDCFSQMRWKNTLMYSPDVLDITPIKDLLQY